MRRSNLVLNEQLLETATRVLGAKTYSAAVNTALEEVIRLKTSTDCLIAAIAIENSTPVWHRDQDFAAIARFTARAGGTNRSRSSGEPGSVRSTISWLRFPIHLRGGETRG